jgi:hypothetical protein
MSISVAKATRAHHEDGIMIVAFEGGVEIRFPVKENPRLAKGSPGQLDHVEISPMGLHWPDLDEDLSFRGLLTGDFGQESVEPRCVNE